MAWDEENGSAATGFSSEQQTPHNSQRPNNDKISDTLLHDQSTDKLVQPVLVEQNIKEEENGKLAKDNKAEERSSTLPIYNQKKGEAEMTNGGGGPDNNNDTSVEEFDEEHDFVEPFMESRLTRRAIKDYINDQDLLPDDTTSFLITSKVKSMPFLVALLTDVLKMATLFVVARSYFDFGNSRLSSMPAGVDGTVQVSQLLSIVLSLLSQEDVTHSLRVLRNGYSYDLLRREFPDVAKESNLCLFLRWNISWWIRFIGGLLGQFLTLILIMQADNVLDVLLNYAAMAFIAEIDNKVFFLGRWKYFGDEVHKHCCLVMLSENPDAGPRCYQKFAHTIVMGILYIFAFAGWARIVWLQNNGHYLCKNVLVQFGDDVNPSLGSFNGVYDFLPEQSIGTFFRPKRAIYLERRSKLAAFFYCENQQSWVFWYTPNEKFFVTAAEAVFRDATENNKTFTYEDYASFYNQDILCDNADAFSSTTYSFDLLATSTDTTWYAKNDLGRVIALDDKSFSMACHDCDRQEFQACEGHGICIPDKGCQCGPEWYGINCQFLYPCPELQTDVRGKSFQSTRSWSDTYHLLRADGNGTIFVGANDDDDEGEIVSIYEHPVYVYNYPGSRVDVLFFRGRRWALTRLADIRRANNNLTRFVEISKSFHSYYFDHTVEFLSEGVDESSGAATPVELEWLGAKPEKKLGLQTADPTQPSDTVLICTKCDQLSNPCFFNEVCSASGNCLCSSTGSKGSLCQVPPTGDGRW